MSASIKREIGHLCHDERRSKPAQKGTLVTPTTSNNADLPRTYAPGKHHYQLLLLLVITLVN